ncbi:hypothetical protein Tsubulata_015036 [Turnera subulata]|uniref:C2H2-type domain-containing protein n=1 Tax=Turnera subulata TaxID=218843 RepID=A0A9Q0F5V0_9ROSI|nr:hypothetical protein Tsubulata_015036 [Turnera subulata]
MPKIWWDNILVLEVQRSQVDEKMGSSTRRENVMLVELAVRRELAYREKVASTKSQVTSSSSNSCPKPSESPRLPGTKLQAPISNIELSATPQLHKLENQIDFCQVQFSSPNPNLMPCSTPSSSMLRMADNFRMLQPPLQLAATKNPAICNGYPKSWLQESPDYSSATNILKSQGLQLPATKKPRNLSCHPQRTDKHFCKLCGVRCSGPASHEQHMKGNRHLLNLCEQELQNKDSDKQCEVESQRRWCQLCKLWCMDESSFMYHLSGRKHRDAVTGKSGGDITKQQLRWCALCNTSFVSEKLLNMHFNRRHRMEMQKLENSRKGGCDAVKKRHWCKVCDIWCVDQRSLDQHLHGKKHILKLDEAKKKLEIEMGDATLEDIMPVELAVQRELAYRRKIAELQPSSGRANFWKTLMPLEEQSSSSGTNSAAGDVLSGIAVQEAPSRHCFLSSPLPRELERQPEFGFFKVRSCSNPRSSSNTVPNSSLTHGLLEMKRQGPTNSLDFFPSHQAHELLHQMDNYFCKTCQVACSSKRNYREHVKGRMHLSKLGELKMRLGRKECGKQYVYEAAPANQRRRCEMCNIWFVDDDLFKEHLSGQKHNAQMAISKSKRAGEETVKVPSRSWCEICGVGGTSEDIERHFGGQKHKAQLLRLERARNVGGGDISKQQWCEICGVGGTIEDIERHFGGQKHKVQLLRLERARNIIG